MIVHQLPDPLGFAPAPAAPPPPPSLACSPLVSWLLEIVSLNVTVFVSAGVRCFFAGVDLMLGDVSSCSSLVGSFSPRRRFRDDFTPGLFDKFARAAPARERARGVVGSHVIMGVVVVAGVMGDVTLAGLLSVFSSDLGGCSIFSFGLGGDPLRFDVEMVLADFDLGATASLVVEEDRAGFRFLDEDGVEIPFSASASVFIVEAEVRGISPCPTDMGRLRESEGRGVAFPGMINLRQVAGVAACSPRNRGKRDLLFEPFAVSLAPLIHVRAKKLRCIGKAIPEVGVVVEQRDQRPARGR